MGVKITVQTSRLDGVADQVENKANAYKADYVALYQNVEALQNGWTGEDNVAYTNQIEGFHDDFDRMYQLMMDYAAYLRKAAATYRATQDAIANAAKTLSQGN